jgi:hypothetical protein
MDEDSKKILDEIFTALELSPEVRRGFLVNVQQKLAGELLRTVAGELPEKYRQFAEKEAQVLDDPNHPMLGPIREELKKLHSVDDYKKINHTLLKRILPEYISLLTAKLGLSGEKSEKLETIVAKFR